MIDEDGAGATTTPWHKRHVIGLLLLAGAVLLASSFFIPWPSAGPGASDESDPGLASAGGRFAWTFLVVIPGVFVLVIAGFGTLASAMRLKSEVHPAARFARGLCWAALIVGVLFLPYALWEQEMFPWPTSVYVANALLAIFPTVFVLATASTFLHGTMRRPVWFSATAAGAAALGILAWRFSDAAGIAAAAPQEPWEARFALIDAARAWSPWIGVAATATLVAFAGALTSLSRGRIPPCASSSPPSHPPASRP